jgi:putative copper resistance protein D
VWHADPIVLLGLAIAAGAFLLGVRRASGAVSPARVRYFAAALAVLLVALVSPVAVWAEERFAPHMVQHLMLTYVAAPLLAFSAPVTLALQAASPAVRQRWLLPVLRSGPVKVLSHPVPAFCAFAGVMYATHFSGLYDASLRSPVVHGFEHLLYLAAAVLFWWPVVRRDPVPGTFPWPARVLYLLLSMPLQSMLGLAVYSSEQPLYARYAELAPRAEVLDDQHLAGVIMWVGGDVLMLAAIGLAIGAWMRADARETVRLDARLDAARKKLEAGQ